MTVPSVDVDDAVPLIVHPEKVARRLKLPLPLDADTTWLISNAIRTAQGRVRTYLRRPITPQQVTITGLYPWVDGWQLPDRDARAITSTAETDSNGQLTGYYTVTYTTGLDAATDLDLFPIRDFVLLSALNDPEVLRFWRQQNPTTTREITSSSADGQSISYKPSTLGGGGAAGSATPGALPDLTGLNEWQVRHIGVFQRPGTPYTVLGGPPWWW